MTSNVGQNYPYTSETEADRSASDRAPRRRARRPGRHARAEATPLDANERWWVWKCPTRGCPGLLHAAGYAVEKHAVFVVCDGTCAQDLPALSEVTGSDIDRAATIAASRRRLATDAVGIAVSAVGFGFVYGLSAREAGFSPIEAMAMSVIVFAGAAQFAAVGYVASGLRLAGHHPADRAAQRPAPALLRGAGAVAARRAGRASERSWPTS